MLMILITIKHSMKQFWLFQTKIKNLGFNHEIFSSRQFAQVVSIRIAIGACCILGKYDFQGMIILSFLTTTSVFIMTDGQLNMLQRVLQNYYGMLQIFGTEEISDNFICHILQSQNIRIKKIRVIHISLFFLSQRDKI